MHIFDSKTKTKRLFLPQTPNYVSIYVCGPTVYDNAHLGHAKSALVFDLLRRVLEAEGLEVFFVRNITDIDDKIIKKSEETGESVKELTEKYTTAYHNDLNALGVKKPSLEPKATESISAMINMINSLLDKGYAYKISNGDIYFNTQKDNHYLSLSNRQNFETISRVEKIVEKKHESDFALWKAVNDGSVAFESPFGLGRPGWHLECSAMIEAYVKKENTAFAVDIHGGGADLLFPHHENEAAQTRCSTDHELAAYWVHNGFVNINGEKMSKSLGNSFFLKDALKIYHGEVLRFYLLSTYYRSDFNFNEEDLLSSKKRLDRLYRLKKRLVGINFSEIQTSYNKSILDALLDDLNVSKAYAILDEFVSYANDKLDQNIKDKPILNDILSTLKMIEIVLGFGHENPFTYFQFGLDPTRVEMINTLIGKRSDAKIAKDFSTSDAIRDELNAMGIALMDTPNGTVWEIRE